MTAEGGRGSLAYYRYNNNLVKRPEFLNNAIFRAPFSFLSMLLQY